jgi:hypothetical protein
VFCTFFETDLTVLAFTVALVVLAVVFFAETLVVVVVFFVAIFFSLYFKEPLRQI